MTMGPKFFISVFLLLSVLANEGLCEKSNAKSYYTIVGSKVVKPNSNYNIALTSHGLSKECSFHIGIKASQKIKDKYEDIIFANETFTIAPWETKLASLPIGNLPPDVVFQLYAEDISDIFKPIETKLQVNHKAYSAFIQTDKAIYKPGDLIRFRIIFLNKTLRKADIKENINVYISDGDRNRIKQFSNITLTQGVFSNELKLSPDPVLGNWKITVDVNGTLETKEIEVDEYVLPKFDVKIITPEIVNYRDGKIIVTIESKYTYGKGVKGEVTVFAGDASASGPSPSMPDQYGSNKCNSGSNTGFAGSRKTTNIDGRTVIEFDIKNDLKIYNTEDMKSVDIEATVEEGFTRKTRTVKSKLTLRSGKYDVKIIGKSFYKPGIPYSAHVKVTYHDGTPVQNASSPVRVVISDNEYTYSSYYGDRNGLFEQRYYNSFNEENIQLPTKIYIDDRNLTLDKNGMARIDFNSPNGAYKRFRIQAIFEEARDDFFYLHRPDDDVQEFIDLRMLNENPKLNDEIILHLEFTHPPERIYYIITGSGELIESQSFTVNKVKEFEIKFIAKLTMAPLCKVHVYYITGHGDFIMETIDLNLKSKFYNSLDLQLTRKLAKPGEFVDFVVKSKTNSYIGLLGVDQSTLLLKSGNDLDAKVILNSVLDYGIVDSESKSHVSYGESYIPDKYKSPSFNRANAILLTNANPVVDDYTDSYITNQREMSINYPHTQSLEVNKVSFAAPASALIPGIPVYNAQKAVTIRKEFPETWIWKDINDTGNDNETKFTEKVPDSITSWIITGFTIDPITGFAMTDEPRKLNVFRPFFISTELPYSMKRGEVISVPIIVFNYQNIDIEAEVIFDNSYQEFEFVESTEDISQKEAQLNKKKVVVVKANDGVTLSFNIKPVKVGYIKIKAVATAGNTGDGIERELLVEAEGVTQYHNQAILIDLRSTPTLKSSFNLEIPTNAIPNSEKISFDAIADVLGPTVQNIDHLIRQPYGCGEQNLLNFVPNIIILDYLTAINQATDDIKRKSITYMEEGYQRQLQYMKFDGSFSSFKSTSSSTWLTAFVVKSFNSAKKYITIDENLLLRSLRWLSRVQAENGSFPEEGNVFHKEMQGGSSNGLALTSYVLATFLEFPIDSVSESYRETFSRTIENATNYIVKELETTDDIYALAVTAYALQLTDRPERLSVLEKLKSFSKQEKNEVFWEKPLSSTEISRFSSLKPTSINVEITAYALLAFIEHDISASLPIMKWLVSQRNENGGFKSTQDTVVGLTALSKIASKILSADTNININLKYLNQTSLMTINFDEAMVLKQISLPSNVRTLEIEASGTGIGIVQLNYKYNTNSTQPNQRFILTPKVSRISSPDFLELRVCTSYIPITEIGDLKSNMVVMEVSLPSGFTADLDALQYEQRDGISKIDTKDGDSVVVLYFDQLDQYIHCPKITALRTHRVGNQKPVPVLIYDYYDDSKRAQAFYRPVHSSLCDFCDGDDCDSNC